MPVRGSKPGEHRGGRKAGTPNKVTANVKAALLHAYAAIGGDDHFAKWARKNPTEFYKLYAKLLPTEVSVTGEMETRTITEVIVRTREEAAVVLALIAPAEQPGPALPEASRVPECA
jgi:hypothetical protein